MLDQIIESFKGPQIALLGPFILLILNSVGFPAPEDLVLVASGFLAAKFGHGYFLILPVVYVGLLIGDSTLFFVGRHFGPRIVGSRFGRLIVSEKRILKARMLFDEWGMGLVFVGRYVPGFRSAVFFSAGMLGFNYYRFLAIDAAAALVSVPALVGLGFWGYVKFQQDISKLEAQLSGAQGVLLAVVGVIGIALFVYLWKKSQKS